METIKLKTRTDSKGTLRLDLSTQLTNCNVEVLVVLQPSEEKGVDSNGWPLGYFEEIDAIEADDLLERPEQGIYEAREPFE